MNESGVENDFKDFIEELLECDRVFRNNAVKLISIKNNNRHRTVGAKDTWLFIRLSEPGYHERLAEYLDDFKYRYKCGAMISPNSRNPIQNPIRIID